MTENREQGFDGEAGYAAAIDAVLAATRQDICVFDRLQFFRESRMIALQM